MSEILATIPERSSAVYTATLTDETGAAVAAGALTSLTLTLYEEGTEGTVNARSGQNILNANNVTMSEAGVLTWAIQPADTACLTSAELETHVALFRAAWGSGGALNWEARFGVENLRKVTA